VILIYVLSGHDEISTQARQREHRKKMGAGTDLQKILTALFLSSFTRPWFELAYTWRLYGIAKSCLLPAVGLFGSTVSDAFANRVSRDRVIRGASVPSEPAMPIFIGFRRLRLQ